MDTVKILKGILGGNATRSKRIESVRGTSEAERESMGRSLEDMLGVGRGGSETNQSRSRRTREPQRRPEREPQRAPAPRAQEPPRRSGNPLEDLLGGILGGGRRRQTPPVTSPRRAPQRPNREAQAEAVFLIRAMCNAAKVDGEIDRQEQDAILSRLGDVTEEELEFVRSELKAPLNVTAFCRSVPEELAEQVYGFSVMALNLDTLEEAAYLGRLAQGLRLDERTCNRLHDQVRAPQLF